MYEYIEYSWTPHTDRSMNMGNISDAHGAHIKSDYGLHILAKTLLLLWFEILQVTPYILISLSVTCETN
jgi:hypothetical protein